MTAYNDVAPPASTTYSDSPEPIAEKQFMNGVAAKFQNGAQKFYNYLDTLYTDVSPVE